MGQSRPKVKHFEKTVVEHFLSTGTVNSSPFAVLKPLSSNPGIVFKEDHILAEKQRKFETNKRYVENWAGMSAEPLWAHQEAIDLRKLRSGKLAPLTPEQRQAQRPDESRSW